MRNVNAGSRGEIISILKKYWHYIFILTFPLIQQNVVQFKLVKKKIKLRHQRNS